MDTLQREERVEEPEHLKPEYVVGIGASAGGLDALTAFFSHSPISDQAAFVVVQHLAPTFKSMMDQLLQRQTQMPVNIITHGERVKAGHVYLIPPNYDLTICEGSLQLTQMDARRSLHLPIDSFFISLAEDQSSSAIAVVLSGTGSDGARGISRIKEKGGLVIVQVPEEAEFDGMPNSAIRTNLVDAILPVAEIPSQLASYMHHPFVGEKSHMRFREHISQKAEIVEKILRKLEEFNGFDFLEYKPSTIARRIERRMGIRNVTDIAEYCALIDKEEHELPTLCQEILIGVTEFFRDPDVFEYLSDTIIPEIVKRKASDDEIRVWVSACSTGEEAYSIAIAFDEVLESLRRHNPVKIFATDIDERAIAIAAKGQYPAGALVGISEARRAQYFNINGSEYLISPKIRKTVVFAHHNLIKDPPFSSMDLITCRNLLIYLQNTAQERALSLMHFALQPEGFLLLGVSESPGNLESYFAVTDNRKKIYQKKHDVRIPISRLNTRMQRIAMPQPAKNGWPANVAVPPISRQRHRFNSSPSAAFLLARYAPPALVVNENSEIVYVNGEVGDYTRKLSTGEFRGTLEDVLLADVNASVSTALYRVKKENKEVRYRAVKFSTSAGEMETNVSVAQLDTALTNGVPMFAVIFEGLESSGKLAHVEPSLSLSEDAIKRMQDLEDELADNRKLLRVTVEELETTNEELQSANEELMAANEELQSTNEELQSVNEELFTVNQEYQAKIHELTDTYNDLNNLLLSTNLAVIFLDEDLNIRRFTPPAVDFFNLKSIDIGRPITDFTSTYELPNIADYYESVTKEGCEKNFTVVAEDKTRLALKILPYRAENETIDGIVLILDKLIDEN